LIGATDRCGYIMIMMMMMMITVEVYYELSHVESPVHFSCQKNSSAGISGSFSPPPPSLRLYFFANSLPYWGGGPIGTPPPPWLCRAGDPVVHKTEPFYYVVCLLGVALCASVSGVLRCLMVFGIPNAPWGENGNGGCGRVPPVSARGGGCSPLPAGTVRAPTTPPGARTSGPSSGVLPPPAIRQRHGNPPPGRRTSGGSHTVATTSKKQGSRKWKEMVRNGLMPALQDKPTFSDFGRITNFFLPLCANVFLAAK